VAAGAGKSKSRVEQERARVYRARQEFHQGLIARRRRDNLIAGVAGGALILAVIGGQIAFYTVGPGAPVPTPSATPTPTDAPTPAPTTEQTPVESPAPTP